MAHRGASDAAGAEAGWAPVLDRIAKQAPPEWIYRANLALWVPVHTLPAVELELLLQERGNLH